MMKIYPIRRVTIGRFAELSGYTEKAIRGKIHDGTWEKDRVCVKAPDGRILVNIDGFNEWVEGSIGIDWQAMRERLR
ncbi:excisionase [Trinickia caryophylli]|uniref:Excisionase n=1 Tax=Trinickia caryophylli TaxID=28094 RepID=A0A1X7DYK6_TRICW|nr:hypothetical protein [Trinickia caryophylli]PMS14141.1 excisionase [Trinickia caryophylli]TRX17839.1 excisionase [Trinickia caryophylli]WQE11393.1 excisionase [Trinickia caryophylli]SMF24004.1 hypothetical protein SAMN06295900_104246 [Trinickia caryophylli]GLU32553.1 hypothetical protein Busp01_23950 [Trinickia caryophylli]